jgi:S1-C subfamily serine protease
MNIHNQSKQFIFLHYILSTILLLTFTAWPLSRSLAKTIIQTNPAQALLGEAPIADIAEKRINSVANVSSTKVIKTEGEQFLSPFFNDPFFRNFFGNRFYSVPKERRERSLGSGVIVSDDGLMLTNNHVVENAEEILVTLKDKRELEAEVVGTDPKSDIAVIRLKGELKGLSPIPIGNSGELRLGDIVLAIGNPFGLGHTVTMGIVSAKGRANVGITDYEDFIQTDAAINPGNSGGALLNMKGELVGINTAILSRSGGYQGIGFAIPSNMVAGLGPPCRILIKICRRP